MGEGLKEELIQTGIICQKCSFYMETDVGKPQTCKDCIAREKEKEQEDD